MGKSRKRREEPFAEGLSEAFCLETLRHCQDAVDYYGTMRGIGEDMRNELALETAEDLLRVGHQSRFNPVLSSWARYCSVVCYSAVMNFLKSEGARNRREQAYADGVVKPKRKKGKKEEKR